MGRNRGDPAGVLSSLGGEGLIQVRPEHAGEESPVGLELLLAAGSVSDIVIPMQPAG